VHDVRFKIMLESRSGVGEIGKTAREDGEGILDLLKESLLTEETDVQVAV